MNTNRNWLAFLIGALLAYVCTACAPLPRAGLSFLGCQVDQPCVVLQIESDQLNDAVVFVNGYRVPGYATGKQHSTVSFPSGVLDGGRCATITVRVVGADLAARTTRECTTDDAPALALWIGNPITTTNLVPRE